MLINRWRTVRCSVCWIFSRMQVTRINYVSRTTTLVKYYVNKNDVPQALDNFQKSLDLTDGTTPLYFRSCIYNQIGRQYLFQGMYDDALKMYNKSYLCDSILNDTINMLFGMRDIASVYNFKKNYTQCLRILGKAYLISKKIDNKLLKSSITHSLAVCYNDIGDDKSSKSFLWGTCIILCFFV